MNTTVKTAIMAILLLASAVVAFTSVDADGEGDDQYVAVDTLDKLKEAAKGDKDIRLEGNIVNGVIKIIGDEIDFGDLNIDMNGHQIQIFDGAKISGKGKIFCSTEGSTKPLVHMRDGTITGMTLVSELRDSLISVTTTGSVTIRDCNLYGGKTAGIYADIVGSDSNELTIDHCDFRGSGKEGSISLQKHDKTNGKITIMNNCNIPVLHLWATLPSSGSTVVESEPLTVGKDLNFPDSVPSEIYLKNYSIPRTEITIPSEIVIPAYKEFSVESIKGDGKVIAQPGSKVFVENISVPVEGGGEVIIITDKPTPPVDDDDEFPFIPGQNQSSGKDDTTTYIAVAAAAAVVAVLAVLVMAMSKGKL